MVGAVAFSISEETIYCGHSLIGNIVGTIELISHMTNMRLGHI